jgi:hypothetical protein
VKLDIEFAIRVEEAEFKEDSDICINGGWYSIIYYCDRSDLVEINNECEDNLVTIEDIQKRNNEETHYDKIIRYKENNEIYLIKVNY